ncbi:MAG: hypothetical protein HOC71_16985 [Candidatus Latescibacteria bacterium]|jgi:hypothetical protein|nr:hypothetical protein [Candidatus Latescibacterota bacterium]
MINNARSVCHAWGFFCLFLLTCPAAAENAKPSSGSTNIVVREIPFKVNQGVAVDENYFYAISNTRISKCDKTTGKVIATWQANKKDEAYKHFTHMNSGTVIKGKLYCAHSRYGVDPNDNTIEIWNVEKEGLEHEETIHLPRKYGSLTWIDKHRDGSWWMCYAVYGEGKNKDSKLVKFEYKDKKFIEVKSWNFPKEVIANWGNMSCSGGSWGPEGYLYTTGHDHARTFVLEIDKTGELNYVRTEQDVGFYGQAIAWDRFSERPILWGIVRNKHVTLTLIPGKKKD